MAKENYYIQKGEYLQFDATTIEQYIKDRLADGNSKFTDQVYEGSHFSSIIEVVSYTFNVLMFYLNNTSSESMFSDAQIYENMNRIVKMLGYNPVGYQTSLLAYDATATGLNANTIYNIPRYSYLVAGGTTYSFGEDIVFKGNNISEATADSILYQGKFYEYPIYSAEGERYETIFLTPGENVIVDHFNIHAYVKTKDGVWRMWERIDNLGASTAEAEVFEVRYNENGNYELKFGDGVNGKQLLYGDSVAIYYLQSDGEDNEIAIGDLNDVKYIKFASPQFTTIYSDVDDVLNVGTVAPASSITFTNDTPSTPFSEPETVEEIRENAPIHLKSKNTLSNSDEYESFVTRRFSNMVSDVEVLDNWEYTGSYLKYFYDLGIEDLSKVSRILYNHVMFADSCNFNNVYIFAKPTILGNVEYTSFLSPSLKQLILNSMDDVKLINSEPIICDPIYMAVDIGINDLTTDISPEDADNSELVIVKSKNSFRSDDAIITDVNTAITEYFKQTATTFGMTISFPDLNDELLAIDGVVEFKVSRTDSDSYYSGLSLITWNPIYTDDVALLLRSKTYEIFQVPYLNNSSQFINKIKIETEA